MCRIIVVLQNQINQEYIINYFYIWQDIFTWMRQSTRYRTKQLIWIWKVKKKIHQYAIYAIIVVFRHEMNQTESDTFENTDREIYICTIIISENNFMNTYVSWGGLNIFPWGTLHKIAKTVRKDEVDWKSTTLKFIL